MVDDDGDDVHVVPANILGPKFLGPKAAAFFLKRDNLLWYLIRN